MASRLKLQEELEELLGTKNVYFQPPATVKIKYPCFIYEYASGDTIFADNKPYHYTRRYDLKFIDRDPDSEIPDKVAMHFPMCRSDRNYKADNLNHWAFSLYY